MPHESNNTDNKRAGLDLDLHLHQDPNLDQGLDPDLDPDLALQNPALLDPARDPAPEVVWQRETGLLPVSRLGRGGKPKTKTWTNRRGRRASTETTSSAPGAAPPCALYVATPTSLTSAATGYVVVSAAVVVSSSRRAWGLSRSRKVGFSSSCARHVENVYVEEHEIMSSQISGSGMPTRRE